MEGEEITQIFANRLSSRRDEQGLTQSELAKLVGVSLRSVQAWEGAANLPRPAERRKIAEVLMVDSAYLMGRAEGTKETGSMGLKETPGAYGTTEEIIKEIRTHVELTINACAGDRHLISWTLAEVRDVRRRLPLPIHNSLNSPAVSAAAAATMGGALETAGLTSPEPSLKPATDAPTGHKSPPKHGAGKG